MLNGLEVCDVVVGGDLFSKGVVGVVGVGGRADALKLLGVVAVG